MTAQKDIRLLNFHISITDADFLLTLLLPKDTDWAQNIPPCECQHQSLPMSASVSTAQRKLSPPITALDTICHRVETPHQIYYYQLALLLNCFTLFLCIIISLTLIVLSYNIVSLSALWFPKHPDNKDD